MAEQLYTLAEAEVILRQQMVQQMCLVGVTAPGHLVQETVTRDVTGAITAWSLRCGRCGADFLPSWP